MADASSIVAKLKRRNVHRAAMLYAASAWLLKQVATQVFPFFHVAEWVVRWIVIAAAMTYFAQGENAQGQVQLADMIQHYADFEAANTSNVYASRGDADQGCFWLACALATRDSGVAAIYEDPFLVPTLREDPRLAAFMKKVGLPDPSTVPDPWATHKPTAVP